MAPAVSGWRRRHVEEDGAAACRRGRPLSLESVTVSPQGPVDYPLGDLTPDRFESLVFLLARTTDLRVLPVRAHDQGLDARLPGPLGRTRRGWQAKRYTSQINWGECRESVRRALAFWRPPRITFCFPRDLSAAEQDSLGTELADHFPEVRHAVASLFERSSRGMGPTNGISYQKPGTPLGLTVCGIADMARAERLLLTPRGRP